MSSGHCNIPCTRTCFDMLDEARAKDRDERRRSKQWTTVSYRVCPPSIRHAGLNDDAYREILVRNFPCDDKTIKINMTRDASKTRIGIRRASSSSFLSLSLCVVVCVWLHSRRNTWNMTQRTLSRANTYMYLDTFVSSCGFIFDRWSQLLKWSSRRPTSICMHQYIDIDIYITTTITTTCAPRRFCAHYDTIFDTFRYIWCIHDTYTHVDLSGHDIYIYIACSSILSYCTHHLHILTWWSWWWYPDIDPDNQTINVGSSNAAIYFHAPTIGSGRPTINLNIDVPEHRRPSTIIIIASTR